MELKLLKGNSIWIRSEMNEIMLVSCDEETGLLKADITQPAQKQDKVIE